MAGLVLAFGFAWGAVAYFIECLAEEEFVKAFGIFSISVSIITALIIGAYNMPESKHKREQRARPMVYTMQAPHGELIDTSVEGWVDI